MKRFLLSVCAVLIFVVAPASADSKSNYQSMMKAFDARDWDAVQGLLDKISLNDLGPSQQAYVELVQGKYLLNAKDYEAALDHFAVYTAYDGKLAFTDSAKSWGPRGIAECFLNLDQYALALKAIDEAIALEPARRSIFIKARIQFNLGDFENVVELLDEGTPKKASYWNLKGYAQIELGDYVGAIHTLETATSFPNAPGYVWNNLATAFLRQDSVDYAADWKTSTIGLRRALDALDKAVELGNEAAKENRVKAEEALVKRSQ